MNSMLDKKTSLFLLGGLIIGLIIGFYAGEQRQKQRIIDLFGTAPELFPSAFKPSQLSNPPALLSPPSEEIPAEILQPAAGSL